MVSNLLHGLALSIELGADPASVTRLFPLPSPLHAGTTAQICATSASGLLARFRCRWPTCRTGWLCQWSTTLQAAKSAVSPLSKQMTTLRPCASEFQLHTKLFTAALDCAVRAA